MIANEWEDKFKKWKIEKNRKQIDLAEKIKNKESNQTTKLTEEIKQKTFEYLKEPKHVKILKIMAVFIPLIFLSYLVYANFIISQEFEYLYDIGSEGEKYFSPLTRISESIDEMPNYKNLTDHLVYFDVPLAPGSEKINIEVKFKDFFPENGIMSLGAKDQEVWHYTYHPIYNPALNKLSEFEKMENIYLVNKNLNLINYEELKNKTDIILATNKEYKPTRNIVSDYKKSDTIIKTSLRGRHTAYIYTSGDLSLQVKKQDINWYEGSDDLEISIFDLENNLLANMTIEDDGMINVSSKTTAKIQEKNLEIKNLKEEAYKIEFGDFDGLIREIKINTNKIVFQRIFLADNSLYRLETKPSKIFTKINKNEDLELITYHKD